MNIATTKHSKIDDSMLPSYKKKYIYKIKIHYNTKTLVLCMITVHNYRDLFNVPAMYFERRDGYPQQTPLTLFAEKF